MDVQEYRKKQLSEMSDKYLDALIEVRKTEIAELEWEKERRNNGTC